MTQTPVPASKTNTFALVGFIVSLAGLIVGPMAAIVGIVFGHLGLGQIKKTGEQGHGLGVAALAIGYAQIVLAVIGVAIVIFITLVFGWSWWQHGIGMNYNDGMMNS